MVFPYSTAPIIFKLKTDYYTSYPTIALSFEQNGKKILTLDRDRMTYSTVTESGVTTYRIQVILTPAETGKFSAYSPVKTQFQCKMQDGTIKGLPCAELEVGYTINREVIS